MPFTRSRGFSPAADKPKGLIPIAEPWEPQLNFTVSSPDGSEFDICGECGHALYQTTTGVQKAHECKCCIKSGKHNDPTAIRLVLV